MIRFPQTSHVPRKAPVTREEVETLLQDYIEFTTAERLAIGLYHMRTGAYDDTLHPSFNKSGRYVPEILDILDDLDRDGKLDFHLGMMMYRWKMDCRTCVYRKGLICAWGRTPFDDESNRGHCSWMMHPSSWRVMSFEEVSECCKNW